MKTKGFTIVELLVVGVIIMTIGVLVFSFVKGIGYEDQDFDMSIIAPEVESARSSRRMAEELARQNDLLERRLELLEQQQQNKEGR